MINWFDMPAQGLSNGGQFEIKELTATENKVYQKDGEVYNKVTVNVEGGGGGGDFSTAEVTLNLTPPEGVTLVSESVLTSVSSPDLQSLYQCGNVTANNHIVTLIINTAVIESEGFCRIDGIFAYDSEDNEYAEISNITVTEDIIYDSDYGTFRVNGNGTISADISNL